jgi:hypothetical protein
MSSGPELLALDARVVPSSNPGPLLPTYERHACVRVRVRACDSTILCLFSVPQATPAVSHQARMSLLFSPLLSSLSSLLSSRCKLTSLSRSFWRDLLLSAVLRERAFVICTCFNRLLPSLLGQEQSKDFFIRFRQIYFAHYSLLIMPCTLYLCFIPCTLYIIPSTIYIAHSFLHVVYCTSDLVHYTLYICIVRRTLHICIAHYFLHFTSCALHLESYALCIIPLHCTLHIISCTLYFVHYTLHTVHCILHFAHEALYVMHCTLQLTYYMFYIIP